MLSLRRAAELLAGASALEPLAAIARELGFHGRARDLDILTREALGVPAEVSQARICRGPGSTRALLLDVAPGAQLKEVLARTAARLAVRSPQLLWLLLAIDGGRTHVAIVSFSHERNLPRMRALLCERARVIGSDAETLCALASAQARVDVMTHCRWNEVLGREALTKRFYSTLEGVVDALALSSAHPPGGDETKELALLYVSRLLFLSFLETQGWLNADHGFLANGFADSMANGGRYHRRVLLPLFFGTLNTPPRSRSPRAQAFGRIPFLNGGLFSRTPLERKANRLEFSDEAVGLLYGDLLCRHRFTPREDSGEWSEAAVDPEMLGRAFESLMASRDRKASGAFYTPQLLVERIMRGALAHTLARPDLGRDQIESFIVERHVPRAARAGLLSRIATVRILDPACGSGAFLVFALRELSWLALASGDARPRGEITRTILTRSIFGVDINPMAVWLCELRLWLAMVMEQRDQGVSAVTPLPNLDRQIRTGDTLAGGTFIDPGLASHSPVARIRSRYSRARGQRKKALAKMLDRAERQIAIESVEGEMSRTRISRRDLLLSARARDFFGERTRPPAEVRQALSEARLAMRTLRERKRNLQGGAALPFSFGVHFAEVAAAGGFDLVIGNPPWVRLHQIPPRDRARLREGFAVFRRSAWEAGAAAARAGSGFGAQADLSALFVERSIDLLRLDGVVALLLPSKLWSSLAGGGVRRFLSERVALLTIEDLSDGPMSFDAAVYPSFMLARRIARTPARVELTGCAVHRRDTVLAWRVAFPRIPLDESPGSPWIIAPPDVRAAFEKLRAAGVPLAETRLGRPLLGVKSGCNEAFVVTLTAQAGDDARIVRSGQHTGAIESGMLRRVVRGEDVEAWSCADTANRVIWTHGEDARPLKTLPADAKRWLGHYRGRLERRTDAKSTERWWSLFRTDGARSDRPRVVWADVGKRPRAAVLGVGDDSVPLNTCYVVRCRDQEEALTLAAILNSDVAAAWLNLFAEPARGGYHRYLGWTLALFPLPRDWAAACSSLPEVARHATGGRITSRDLLEAVLRAYGVGFDEIAPLLAWSG